MTEFFSWLRMALCTWLARPVCYIGGSEVLPPPLSAEEEAAALAGCAAGDESARSCLIEHRPEIREYRCRA